MQELPGDPDEFFKKIRGIQIDPVASSDGMDDIGYVIRGKKLTEDLRPPLPIHLTVCILAYSRRHMSKMIRHVDGYYNPKTTFLYTDTDSLLVTRSTWNMLKKFHGDELGKLQDELPGKTIVAARFLAPKTYCLAMLVPRKDAPNQVTTGYKVRCKGIPHRGDVFLARDYLLGEKEWESSIEKVDEILAGDVNDLKNRYYVLVDSENNADRQVIPFINIAACDRLLAQTDYLETHYGSIIRKRGECFVLNTTWCHRSIGKASWWQDPECPRQLLDEEGFKVTKCKGYPEAFPQIDDEDETSEFTWDYDIVNTLLDEGIALDVEPDFMTVDVFDDI